jgi:hypothetical protein
MKYKIQTSDDTDPLKSFEAVKLVGMVALRLLIKLSRGVKTAGCEA